MQVRVPFLRIKIASEELHISTVCITDLQNLGLVQPN
jgi:hypothetical protein